MLLKVKYRAIKFDNFQGGSGMPFLGEDFIEMGDNVSLIYAYKAIASILEAGNKQKTNFIDNRSLVSVEIINLKV